MKISKIITVVLTFALLAFLAKKFLFTPASEKYYDKGISYYSNKKYETAIYYLGLANNPENYRATKALASANLEAGHFPESEKYFIKLLSFKDIPQEDYKLILNDIGVCYFKMNKFDKAKEYWTKGKQEGNPTCENNLQQLNSFLRTDSLNVK